MAYRVLSSDQIEGARQLRREGWSDVNIAKQFNVGDRTIRRALGPRRVRIRQGVGGSDGVKPDWLEDWHWPGEWTGENASEQARPEWWHYSRSVWPDFVAENVSRAATLLQRQQRKYAVAYLKRWIEQIRSFPDLQQWAIPVEWRPDFIQWITRDPSPGDFYPSRAALAGSLSHWAAIRSGLDMLAWWLNEPSCQDLDQIIADREPWAVELALDWANYLREPNRHERTAEQANQGEMVVSWYQKQIRAYGGASREAVRAIRARLDQLDLDSILGTPTAGGQGPLLYLKEVVRRLPVPEMVPLHQSEAKESWGSSIPADVRNLAMWQLFTQAFRFDPPKGV